MKKIITLLFLFLILPVCARNVVVESLDDFDDKKDVHLNVRVLEHTKFKSGLVLNIDDEIKSAVIKSTLAKRGKRQAHLIIIPQEMKKNDETISIREENLEAKVIGYYNVNWVKRGVNAGIWTGLVVGSLFLPGISQAYYFSKGFITQDYDFSSRWKSGFKSIYKNSPFVFFEKGSNLEINKGDYLILKFYYPNVSRIRYFKRTK